MSDQKLEAAQAAQRRRRWLTLGETVGVLALVISAASFWDSHQDRAREQAKQAAPALKPRLLLTGTASDEGARLRLAPADPALVIQTQALHFPATLNADPVETTGDARIDSDWFGNGLRARAADHGDKPFTGRMPIAIITRFARDGQQFDDAALYDLGYTLHPRLLRADRIELQGLRLVAHASPAEIDARLEARWKAGNPGG